MNTPGVDIISGEVRTISTGNDITIANANNNLTTVHVNMRHMMKGIQKGVYVIVEMTKSGPKSIVTYPSTNLHILHGTLKEHSDAVVYEANYSMT